MILTEMNPDNTHIMMFNRNVEHTVSMVLYTGAQIGVVSGVIM